MDPYSLENLTQHVNDKISGIKKIIELRTIGKDPDRRNILQKIGQDILSINSLLNQFEKHIIQQKEMIQSLKELEEFFKEDVKEAKHLKENIPPHMPRKATATESGQAMKPNKDKEDKQASAEEPLKKPSKKLIKEMEYVTTEEFDNIPQYMKGRLSYDQLNSVIKEINKAVTCKYQILFRPLKSVSNVHRKLYQRFKDEETKDTKGQFFIVDADIKEFTQMNADKRFQSMMNMLRHTQRLRESRGGGILRYILL
ncbi:SKA complex subunit 1 [Amia ocellicauda]|uniref:SKA complex subunit 1 n=1 Tax=Amia ocellicauda TaxID=2972642 RepID=UPI003464A078|nr:SKA1 protein [Amia calva]